MDNYLVMIGLEMHCEISETKSKVFSSARNDYSDLPNSNIRPVDMAFPGTLPVVNKKAIEYALMASMILNCKQPEYMYFERKNYYYHDLPKGFQITQETKPAPVGIYGKLEYECNGEIKTALINNLHLEELISPFSKRHPLLILIVLRIMSPCCALSTNLINTLYQAKITIKITYMVKKLTKTA